MEKRISYFDEKNGFSDNYSYEYPSESELLEIFPESVLIIPVKLKEWKKRRDKASNRIKKALKKYYGEHDAITEVERSFAEGVCDVMVPELEESLKHISRLERLQRLMISKAKERAGIPTNREDFEQKKTAAKEVNISELYPFRKIRRIGQRFSACCPFHQDDTPSFIIYPDNHWHCFGCNKGGDSIDFIKELRSCNYKEAVHELAGCA